MRTLSNDQQLADSRTRTHDKKCACGFCVYSGLFLKVTELRCKCPNPTWVGFTSVGLDGIGTFCSDCGNLHFTSLVNYYMDCEGCGQFCTYDFRQFLPTKPWNPSKLIKLPLPVTLCRRCDDVSVAAPSHGTRRGFHIN